MLVVGDDWAEGHHDIEVQDEQGRRLARARLPEGIAGPTRLHELLAEHLAEDDVDPDTGFVVHNVVVGIETDRGTRVSALVAAGYEVFPLNPVQVARHRERHGSSGAKSHRGMRTCWPRSSAWIGPTTGLWPGTAPKSRAQAGRPLASGVHLGPHPPLSAAAQRAARSLSRRARGLSRPDGL